jgi:putative redox protein
MNTISVSSLASQPYRTQIQAGNHTFYADVPQNLQGGDTAPTPHEMLLGALGACTTITLQMYAKRKNWDLKEVKVNIQEDEVTVAGTTRKIPRISKTIEVKGNLDPTQVLSLKDIAEKCPVNKLLKGEKEITSTINLIA